MTEKRYCFVPETTKVVSVFNTHNETLKNYAEFINCKPDVSFKISIDEFDKIKLFYVNGKENAYSTDDKDYLNIKVKNAIRAIFGVRELAEFNLILDDENPRAEFTIFYDIDGNECSKYNLGELNLTRTILAHTYVYNVYKRYNLK